MLQYKIDTFKTDEEAQYPFQKDFVFAENVFLGESELSKETNKNYGALQNVEKIRDPANFENLEYSNNTDSSVKLPINNPDRKSTIRGVVVQVTESVNDTEESAELLFKEEDIVNMFLDTGYETGKTAWTTLHDHEGFVKR